MRLSANDAGDPVIMRNILRPTVHKFEPFELKQMPPIGGLARKTFKSRVHDALDIESVFSVSFSCSSDVVESPAQSLLAKPPERRPKVALGLSFSTHAPPIHCIHALCIGGIAELVKAVVFSLAFLVYLHPIGHLLIGWETQATGPDSCNDSSLGFGEWKRDDAQGEHDKGQIRVVSVLPSLRPGPNPRAPEPRIRMDTHSRSRCRI